jgi:hypothetical protein
VRNLWNCPGPTLPISAASSCCGSWVTCQSPLSVSPCPPAHDSPPPKWSFSNMCSWGPVATSAPRGAMEWGPWRGRWCPAKSSTEAGAVSPARCYCRSGNFARICPRDLKASGCEASSPSKLGRFLCTNWVLCVHSGCTSGDMCVHVCTQDAPMVTCVCMCACPKVTPLVTCVCMCACPKVTPMVTYVCMCALRMHLWWHVCACVHSGCTYGDMCVHVCMP